MGVEGVAMSDYTEYGGIEEDAKTLMKKVHDFYSPQFKVLYDAIYEAYQQGYQDGLEESK